MNKYQLHLFQLRMWMPNMLLRNFNLFKLCNGTYLAVKLLPQYIQLF